MISLRTLVPGRIPKMSGSKGEREEEGATASRFRILDDSKDHVPRGGNFDTLGEPLRNLSKEP